MKKICTRCEASFECNHDNIVDCKCAMVQLDSNMRNYIKENYDDCLCPDCLTVVKEGFYAAGVNPSKLKQA